MTQPNHTPPQRSERSEQGYRRIAARILDPLFKVLLTAFLLFGTVLVLLQFVGIIVSSSGLVAGAMELLGPPTFAIAGATGILGFILAYVHRWDTSD